MLSTGAFNALLKTLEEPPAHVKFILATTEPQKLPATILSRCQRFDFKKISDEYIIKRLEIISKETNINITQEALKLIALLAEGGMRDAISILERCVQDGDINITEDKIKELVGIPKLVQINKLVENIIKYNPSGSLEVSEEIIAEGKDITNVLWEVIKYIKDMLIYKTSGDIDIYSEEDKEKIKELVKEVSTERLIKMINDLSELENNLKWSSQRNLFFETGIIKISSNFACSGYEEIEKRLLTIEEQLKSGKLVQKVDNISKNQSKTANVTNTKSDIVKEKNVEEETANTIKTKIGTAENANTAKELKNNSATSLDASNWKTLVDNLKNNGKMMLYTNLINTTAKVINDMTVGIEFKNGLTPFGKTVLEKPENMQYLVKAVSQICGKEMRIKLIDGKAGTSSDNIGMNNVNDMPFNIID